MGCGASKGKAEGEAADVTELEFKPIGAPSLDEFFAKAKELLDSIADITGPLGEQKD